MGEKGRRQWKRGSAQGTVFDFDEGGMLHYAARQWPQKARQSIGTPEAVTRPRTPEA